jgi:hypothetical protein
VRILVVGKYPPIQGGTSNRTFNATRSLLQRGHDIDVLTNADEVELSCAQMFLSDDPERLQALITSPTGATVTVHQTSPLFTRAVPIPWAQPYASKLFGRGIELVRSREYDLIVGWYLEPYGLVAAQIAEVSGTPLLLIHAGSDIGRLAEHPDLFPAYQWAFQRAQYVVTTPRARDMVVDLGANPERLIVAVPSSLPDYFSDPFSPMNLDEVRSVAIERFQEMQLSERLTQMLVENLERTPDLTDGPVIGICGKVASPKGSYDLISALETLAGSGLKFTLLGVVGGRENLFIPFLSTIADTKFLRERTVLLPFVAPWRVPNFLDACDLVCFLERDFYIGVHLSRVPVEVLKRGRALVLSGEMSAKLRFLDYLVDDDNYVLVQDPSDVPSLAKRLGSYLTDPSAVQRIATAGGSLGLALFSSQADGHALAIEGALSDLRA